MSYSLSVTNNSGAAQPIAIYQEYPNLLGGLPLVWFTQTVNNGNEATYTWNINWALNWGTTPQPLAAGVLWTSGGPVQNMSPNSSSGNNAMGITHSADQFETNPLAYHDGNVGQGQMLVTTDTTFTVPMAELMSVSVYMDGKAAFAVQGKPNGKYLFSTHPTYYICVTQSKESVAISSTFVSSPTKFVFEPGITSLSFILDDTLQFKAS